MRCPVGTPAVTHHNKFCTWTAELMLFPGQPWQEPGWAAPSFESVIWVPACCCAPALLWAYEDGWDDESCGGTGRRCCRVFFWGCPPPAVLHCGCADKILSHKLTSPRNSRYNFQPLSSGSPSQPSLPPRGDVLLQQEAWCCCQVPPKGLVGSRCAASLNCTLNVNSKRAAAPGLGELSCQRGVFTW